MVNKLGKLNWMQSALPVSGGKTAGIKKQSQINQNVGTANGNDLMTRLNALDNRELKPKTDSKFDIMA